MEIGLMWVCENEEDTLIRKLTEAMEYYKNKYGKYPNICFLNGKMLLHEDMPNSIVLRPTEQIPMEYLWLGISDDPLA